MKTRQPPKGRPSTGSSPIASQPLPNPLEADKKHLIYDALYGLIPITSIEWKIIHSPFYQRLKWIRQLGFTFYTFPGAEHSRFGHSLGVMHNAHCILQRIGKAVPDEELFTSEPLRGQAAIHHQMVRLAALLHDIGTFPFSHTTEMSYLRYGEGLQAAARKGQQGDKQRSSERSDDHEHLGSFIIKRTSFPGGITAILEESGIDPQIISDLIKGNSTHLLFNQILHSEIDCDRMDYLLRDAHYTGLQYGAYDRDYLLHHFKCVTLAGQDILAINEKAIYCVQDFLMARFAWYSQVIRSPRGAKYDALAEEICFQLLKRGLIYRYGDLLELIEKDPQQFFAFNDQYFMTLLQQVKPQLSERKKEDRRLSSMIEHLLFAKELKSLKLEAFSPSILEQDNSAENQRIRGRAAEQFERIATFLREEGSDQDWVLNDLPRKDVVLVKSHRHLVKHKKQPNLLLETGPAKIVCSDGQVMLLANYQQGLIHRLQHLYNYLPNVFCSQSAYEKLLHAKLI